MAIRKETYTLTNNNIDRISQIASDEMDAFEVQKEHQIKTRFSIEEALLRLKEHFGNRSKVTVTSSSRLGRHYIEIRLRGEAYNPLRFSSSEFDEWDQMLSYSDYQPDYYYTGTTNIVRWSVPARRKHPVFYYSAAIICGILLGFILKVLAGNEFLRQFLVVTLGTIEEIWIRLLNVLCGPVIFLLIITTILNMDAITRQGESTRRFLLRVFRMSITAAAISIPASILLMPGTGFSGFGKSATDFSYLLLELVPEDAVSPFASSNVPQLLLLGVVLGSALIASGKRYNIISDFVHEANSIGLYVTGWVSNTAPFFICILLAYEVLRGNVAIYTGMWKPLLVLLLVSMFMMICYILITAKAKGCSIGSLIEALKGPFLRTLKSGSSDSVLDYTLKNCHEKLGIDRRYAEAGLTIGLVMYMPVSAAGTLIFVLYTGSIYDVEATFMWYIIAVVIAVTMSVAVPPVPGVGILTYVVMFVPLGIPSTALISAMIFDVLTNLVVSAENQLMLQVELINAADRMAMLDKTRIRSSN